MPYRALSGPGDARCLAHSRPCAALHAVCRRRRAVSEAPGKKAEEAREFIEEPALAAAGSSPLPHLLYPGGRQLGQVSTVAVQRSVIRLRPSRRVSLHPETPPIASPFGVRKRSSSRSAPSRATEFGSKFGSKIPQAFLAHPATSRDAARRRSGYRALSTAKKKAADKHGGVAFPPQEPAVSL